jgi:hypothetical protein
MPFLNKIRHRQNTGPLGTMYSFVSHRSSSDEDQLKPGPLTAGDRRRREASDDEFDLDTPS